VAQGESFLAIFRDYHSPLNKEGILAQEREAQYGAVGGGKKAGKAAIAGGEKTGNGKAKAAEGGKKQKGKKKGKQKRK
jgi:hypothetical protein